MFANLAICRTNRIGHGSRQRGGGANQPPCARLAARPGRRAVRSGVTPFGGQRPVRVHGRRDRPADLPRGVCGLHSPGHALPLGLALVAQSRRLVDREVPIYRVQRSRAKSGIRRHPKQPTNPGGRMAAGQSAPTAPGANWLSAHNVGWPAGGSCRFGGCSPNFTLMGWRAGEPFPAGRPTGRS